MLYFPRELTADSLDVGSRQDGLSSRFVAPLPDKPVIGPNIRHHVRRCSYPELRVIHGSFDRVTNLIAIGMVENSSEDWAETLLITVEKKPGLLISNLDNLVTQLQKRLQQLGTNPINRIQDPREMRQETTHQRCFVGPCVFHCLAHKHEKKGLVIYVICHPS